MKKLFLSALLLASHFAFAAADDSAVANRKWVRELLAKSGVRVLNATTTKNLDGSTTCTSAYQSEENPDVASISLTFSPISVVSNGVFASAPRTLLSLLVPSAFAAGTDPNQPPEVSFTLKSGSYLTKTIPAREVNFNFGSGIVLTLQGDVLNRRISSEHTCFFEGKNCICVGARTEESVWEEEAEEFYPIVDAVEFAAHYAQLENWIDTATWADKKTIGKNTFYLITDSLGKSHRMNDIAISDAWIVGLLESAKVINKWNKQCQDHYVLSRMCDKAPTPQHDWGDEVKISETETLVVYEKTCKRCGEKERREIEKGKDPPPGFGCNGDHHVAKPFGCGCICGYYGAIRPHPDTSYHRFTTADCRCNCGHFHRAVASDLCPEVCAYCPRPVRAGISAQIGDAPAKYHIPCGVSDGRCGCKCGMVTAEIDDITFHVFAGGDCQCLGSSGNGGRFHRHMPDPDCKGVCANRNKWGIDGAHTVAPGTVAVRPTKAAVSDHTKSTSSRCGCECGDYNNSNADEWKYAANFHNSDPNDCGCFCEKSHEGQIPEYHKYGGDDNCVCFCEEQHRLIKNKDGLCARVCMGKNHGEGLRGGYYARKDEEGMKTHTPKADACGCECGAFHGSAYTDTGRFHGGYDGKCACDCGTWHKATPGNPCAKVCNTCDKIAKSGIAAEIREATIDDHTRPHDAAYCGCACAEYSTPHRNAADQCYCYGVFSPVGKNNLFEHGEPALIEHINLELTGALATNDFSCGACGAMRTDILQEYKCDNNHFVTSAVPEHICAIVQCLADCDCCDHTDTVPCECPHCNNVEGAKKVCTCSGRNIATDKSKFKITNPTLTAPDFADLFAAIDRDEVVEIDGDDPVYEIADEAMRGACSNMPMLETVKFNFVTNVGNAAFADAFQNCPRLTRVEFSRLKTVQMQSFMEAFKGSALHTLDLPELQSVNLYAFEGIGVKMINVGCLETIPDLSFANCNDLETFTAYYATRIDGPAFRGCPKLRDLIIPTVNRITGDGYTFAYCTSLKKLPLPGIGSIDAFERNTFAGSSVEDLYLPGCQVGVWGNMAAFNQWAEHIALPAGCTVHFGDGDIVYQGPTE